MKLLINGVYVGEAKPIFRENGRVVYAADLTMNVAYTETEDQSKTAMVRGMADAFRFGGTNGVWWAASDDDGITWRVQAAGTDAAHRTGLTEEEAVQQAYENAWGGMEQEGIS